jgi:uncharacterized membrane protein YeiH
VIAAKTFLLPPLFDYSATLVWAISGALLGARRGYAILGIITIALVSATGGGLLRDGVFLQTEPVLLRNPNYLWLVAVGVLVVLLFGRWIAHAPHATQAIVLFDAAGLGAYAVVGMNRALAAGISLPGVIVVGMVNAVGGGILRDILINREPDMFLPGTLAQTLALAGCLLFLTLIAGLRLSQFDAAWITIFVVFVARLIAIRYNIESKPLREFKSDWAPRTETPDE